MTTNSYRPLGLPGAAIDPVRAWPATLTGRGSPDGPPGSGDRDRRGADGSPDGPLGSGDSDRRGPSGEHHAVRMPSGSHKHTARSASRSGQTAVLLCVSRV